MKKDKIDPITSMAFRHTCFQEPVPAEIEGRLISLYQSAFCVPDYFHLFRNAKKVKAIAIYTNSADADHVLYYLISRKELTVLNNVFEIDATCLNYVVAALFDSHKKLHTIHFNNVRTKVEDLTFPYHLWEIANDNIVELPATMADYRKILGKRTKANLSNYRNKLQREYRDFKFSFTTGGDIDPLTIKRIVEMNKVRMLSKRTSSAIDSYLEEKMVQFARKYGIAATISLNGRIAAGTICYQIGNHCYADVIAHDPEYGRYSIGRVCIYLLLEALIEEGVSEFHMGGGDDDYKRKMSTRQDDLHSFSVFKSSLRKRIGVIKHLGKHGRFKAYINMFKYNYVWRFKENFLNHLNG